jgi:hypothetical protein
MKKFTAAAAVLAAAGFTGLSMTPASADQMFQNCTAAKNAGYGVIYFGDPAYSSDLDSDKDGKACEANGSGTGISTPQVPVAPVAPVVPDTTVALDVVAPTNTAVFDNCTAAAAEGRYNIPSTDPRYGTHLDRDLDGIGCEQGTNEVETGTDVIVDYVPESWNNGAGTGTGYGQVGQVPVGGADTGVTVEESSSVSGLALGGMALVAAAGATFMVRRRAQA